MTDDPIATYLSYLQHVRQLSKHTLRGYAHELDALLAFADGRPLASLSAADIRGAVARACGRPVGALDRAPPVGLARFLPLVRAARGDAGQPGGHGARA